MGKYQEKILDSSVWISATPTPLARTLPFYVTETGHFEAEREYEIKREFHDSFLLLYTSEGKGEAVLNGNTVTIGKGEGVLLDCRLPHEYRTSGEGWNFMWAHINGAGVRPVYEILYPDGQIMAARAVRRRELSDIFSDIIKEAEKTDISACMNVSSLIHLALSQLCSGMLLQKHTKPSEDIREAIAFIENNYKEPITVDDMLERVHLSKYHFIRRFKSVMGITPYSYLMTYRINESKSFLRETDLSVSEIAEQCGFLDTSNFIIQFRKHTGQTPAQYRRDFS